MSQSETLSGLLTFAISSSSPADELKSFNQTRLSSEASTQTGKDIEKQAEVVLLSPNLLGSDNNIDQKSETVSAGANSKILNIFAAYTVYTITTRLCLTCRWHSKKVPPSSSWVNFIFFLPNVTVVRLIFVDIYFSTLSEAKKTKNKPNPAGQILAFIKTETNKVDELLPV